MTESALLIACDPSEKCLPGSLLTNVARHGFDRIPDNCLGQCLTKWFNTRRRRVGFEDSVKCSTFDHRVATAGSQTPEDQPHFTFKEDLCADITLREFFPNSMA